MDICIYMTFSQPYLTMVFDVLYEIYIERDIGFG